MTDPKMQLYINILNESLSFNIARVIPEKTQGDGVDKTDITFANR